MRADTSRNYSDPIAFPDLWNKAFPDSPASNFLPQSKSTTSSSSTSSLDSTTTVVETTALEQKSQAITTAATPSLASSQAGPEAIQSPSPHPEKGKVDSGSERPAPTTLPNQQPSWSTTRYIASSVAYPTPLNATAQLNETSQSVLGGHFGLGLVVAADIFRRWSTDIHRGVGISELGIDQ